MVSQAMKNFFSPQRAFIVVGASTNPAKYGHKVLQWYVSNGLLVYAVNPKESKILEVSCFKSVPQVVEHCKEQGTAVDGFSISFITPPSVTLSTLQSLKGYRNDIRSAWFQPGSYDNQVVEYCKDELGLSKENANMIYEGDCILVSGKEALVKHSL